MAALGERGHGLPESVRRVETMVGRHGAALLRVANQFSICQDDALDAYQRGLEIYLRRLDTVDPATEGAWLRVVVKHEAMAIRRARQASVDREPTDLDSEHQAALREVEDTVAGGERVDRSVEALKALKPDEARALLLKAEGLSYDEIGRRFGWTYTKVNRSIAEGRKHFLKVYSGIEAGEACAAHQEALDALAAGRATSAQVVSLRPHLRHCSACRATVRDMRFSRTKRLALLLPIGWLARLVERADLMYAASSGRLGPAATLVGLCLGSAGAGAACLATGTLPPAPIVASHFEPKPAPTPPPARKQHRAAPTPIKTAVPTAVAAATSTPAPTRTATPAPRVVKAKASRKPVVHKPQAKAKPREWSFEGDSAPAPSAPAQSTPVARAASIKSGGGSSGHRSAAKASGSEFGIEGG